ncbi:MAG: rhomboid family intramembrane serine protease [Saprospiraceae bacterium]
MISLTLVLVIMTALISYQAFSRDRMMNELAFHPASIREFGQWYRFITNGFIHADWGHLIINMVVLFQFGEFVEGFFINEVFASETTGRIAFLVFYLSAVVAACIPSYLRHRNNYAYAAVGASGATSALVFAYVIINPWQMFVFPPLPALLFGVFYLFYSSYMDRRGTDNIGHNQHFWGAVYGAAFIVISLAVVRPELFELLLIRYQQIPFLSE